MIRRKQDMELKVLLVVFLVFISDFFANGSGQCDSGNSNAKVKIDTDKDSVKIGESFEIRCIGSNSQLSYYIRNRIVSSFTDLAGRHKNLTESFYPAPEMTEKFKSGHFSITYARGPITGYMFTITIRAFQSEDAGLYTCSLFCGHKKMDTDSKYISAENE